MQNLQDSSKRTEGPRKDLKTNFTSSIGIFSFSRLNDYSLIYRSRDHSDTKTAYVE